MPQAVEITGKDGGPIITKAYTGCHRMTGLILTAQFDPLPWQVAPFRCTDPVVLLTGSAGGGKSRLAAEKVHGYCLRYPGAVAICLRKRREFASKSVVYALKDAKCRATIHGRVPHAGDNMFNYENGSRILWPAWVMTTSGRRYGQSTAMVQQTSFGVRKQMR